MLSASKFRPPAESASKRKIQPNDDGSSLNETAEDDLAPAEGFVKRIHAQTPCHLGNSYVSLIIRSMN